MSPSEAVSPPLSAGGVRARLDRLVEDAAAGPVRALRIIGGAGTGKTTALAHLIGHARAMRLMALPGVRPECDMPYAALHRLVALPPSGRRSGPRPPTGSPDQVLAAALGRHGAVPDERELAEALLRVLSGPSAAVPVCLVVDDAHLIDAASRRILIRVARSTAPYPLLVILADDGRDLGGLESLPALRLPPASEDACGAMLAAIAPGPIDPPVAERILAESRGVPGRIVAALDGLTAAEFAGGFGARFVGGTRCPRDHEPHDLVRRLSPAARWLILAAAADPTGDPDVLRAVAATVPASPLDHLIESGLITVGDRVLFACPSLRSVVYADAEPAARHDAHRILAVHTPDRSARHAWHLALAGSEPGEELATALEAAAEHIVPHAGAAARAVLLDHAARLSAVAGRRTARAIAAAAARYDVGDLAACHRLLALAESGPTGSAPSPHLAWHRARLHPVAGGRAVRELLSAADGLHDGQPVDARDAYLETLLAAISAGPVADAGRREAAEAALVATAEHRTEPVDLLLYGLARRVVDGYTASVPHLRTALTAVMGRSPDARAARWLGLVSLIAVDLWDQETWLRLAAWRQERPPAPEDPPTLSPFHHLRRRASSSGPAPTDPAPLDYTAFLTAAWQGRRDRLEGLLRHAARTQGGPGTTASGAVAAAVLHNGEGEYDRAATAAQEALRSDHPGITGWALIELVEAAVRSGRTTLALRAATTLGERAAAAGTDWAFGLHATAQALLAHGGEAQAHYLTAIDRLTRSGIRCQLGRALLLYGEWLRRCHQRIEARAQLHAARDLFERIGAQVFIDRTDRELAATASAVRRLPPETLPALTPQEYRVSCLARDGLTNPEIATRLYLSRRTVEYHLHKAFAKLGITSRAKIPAALGAVPSDGG